MSEIWLTVQSLWMEFLGAVAIGVLTIVIYKVRKYFANKVMDEGAFVAEVRKSTEIIETLAALRAKMGADRASVFLFHNGNYYMNGDSILKMSCTHQSVAPGISNECHKVTEMLVSSIPEAVEFLVTYDKTKPKMHIIDASKMVTSLYKSLLDNQGVQVEIALPIHNQGQVIGIASLHFLDAHDAEVMRESVNRDDFLESVSILEMLLDQHVNTPKGFLSRFLFKR